MTHIDGGTRSFGLIRSGPYWCHNLLLPRQLESNLVSRLPVLFSNFLLLVASLHLAAEPCRMQQILACAKLEGIGRRLQTQGSASGS